VERNVGLRSYDQYEPQGLGSCLARIIDHDEEGVLAQDFPLLPRRYATAAIAADSVRGVCAAIRRSKGSYGAYIVDVDGRVVGAITYNQQDLCVRSGLLNLFRTKVADGPLIAGWLDPHRHEDERNLLQPMLWMLASQIAKTNCASGRAWTVVRPDNARFKTIDRALTSPGNGFGGFEPQGEPTSYKSIDGVTAHRQLYVARHDLHRMRVELL
jgi:hypothetical protein